MTSRPIFHLFLTLSVVIILLGIMIVIFTQFDRGYVVVDGENNVNTKQVELIKKISQAADKMSLDQPDNKSEDTTGDSVLTLIEQVKQDDSKADIITGSKSPSVTDQEIARINHLNQQNYISQPTAYPYPYSSNSYDNYQSYWLSNNPWSPDYNPNRRY
jgi:hypothetical protein